MKNHWLNNVDKLYVPLDYSDPSLDFFSAKHKIIQYLQSRYNLTNEDCSSAVVQDVIENWAYCVDLLAQSRYQEEKKNQ